MKLFFTNPTNSLTDLLTREAEEFLLQGKRVFYIAPNSLSFEKERRVLEYLPNHATFQMIVTRFGQLPNYFMLPKRKESSHLDDAGLSMLLYRVLNQLSDQSLPVFGRLKKDPGFIEQVLTLYKELAKSQLTLADFDVLISKTDPLDKVAELKTILSHFMEAISSEQLSGESKLQFFMRALSEDKLDLQLKDTVFIIDGFTRFSEEEERLVDLLNQKAEQVLIAAYATKRAYHAQLLSGNIYEASVSFLRELASRYGVKVEELVAETQEETTFSKVSVAFEASHDFSPQEATVEWTDDDKEALQIWEATNQKVEIEAVAKDIRRKIREEGADYKDFTLLLGDEKSYKLPVERLLTQFEIPFYWGRAESMVNHPLSAFMMSLERVLYYYFQREDLINLLKTGLFGHFKEHDLDVFEQYCQFADINAGQFNKPFKHNISRTWTDDQGQKQELEKYDLEKLNQMRQNLIDPLMKLNTDGSIDELLQVLLSFFDKSFLTKNFQALTVGANPEAVEQHEQVWKVFTNLLEQAKLAFAGESLSMQELISLLANGMASTDYRTVPATVNVVNVRSYDLIEPHSAPYVYAIGLGQSSFPKVSQNTSLLSDEERQLINESTNGEGRFDIVTGDNLKKNHFVAISLLNAADKGLVLSYPQLLGEGQEFMSPYMTTLVKDLGFPLTPKQKDMGQIAPDDLGSYKEVLARLISLNRSQFLDKLSQEEVTYWRVLGRVIRKELSDKGIAIDKISKELTSKPLSQEVLEVLFPADASLPLSASSLTRFYNNQYLYFIEKILGLREQDSIHPDARSHGNFLHKVFERALSNQDSLSFKEKLKQALEETKQEKAFQALYEEDQESLYSRELLESIAKATGSLFEDMQDIQVSRQEAAFKLLLEASETHLDRPIEVSGFIDRVDKLQSGSEELAYGVIDYKSSHQRFQLEKFYNGLSPQLMTYLLALKEGKDKEGQPLFDHLDYFGAMYLQMQEPSLALKDISEFGKIPQKIKEDLRYDGLFREEFLGYLPEDDYKFSRNKQAVVYKEEELDELITFLKSQYQEAAETILKGHFAINPYSQDGKSVAGEQLTALTGFEADLHLGQARFLENIKASPGQKRQLLLEKIHEKNQSEKGDRHV
ncbi:ATP-dependent nuclease subunit B [Streptococcus pluranimalium]|uniref:ATP-dependent nuclease subunit B n=1 Tax=Streptococcus pluranimalium TaxID=82348 RepID=UPI004046D159